MLKTGTAVSTSGTTVLCYRFAPPSASRCNGLGGGSSYACTVAQGNFSKQTSSPVLGSSSAVYKTRNGSIPNSRQLLCLMYKSLSNDSMADYCDILKNSDARAGRDRSSRGNGTAGPLCLSPSSAAPNRCCQPRRNVGQHG